MCTDVSSCYTVLQIVLHTVVHCTINSTTHNPHVLLLRHVLVQLAPRASSPSVYSFRCTVSVILQPNSRYYWFYYYLLHSATSSTPPRSTFVSLSIIHLCLGHSVWELVFAAINLQLVANHATVIVLGVLHHGGDNDIDFCQNFIVILDRNKSQMILDRFSWGVQRCFGLRQ